MAIGLTAYTVAYFNQTYQVYAAGRFIIMTFCSCGYLGFQHCMERMAPQYRATMAMIVETTACGIGIMIVSLIGHVFNTWVHYYLVLGTICISVLPIFKV